MDSKGSATEISPLKEKQNDSACARVVAAAMIFTCTFINYATYDMPGSLERIMERIFNLEAYQFEYLYTLYAVPPIFLCLFVGIIIDKVLGLVKGSIYSFIIFLLGQVIITIGGFAHKFWALLLGRFIYGIGTESINIILNCYVVIWFKNKEMNFIFGIFQCLNRLGSSFAFSFALPLYNYLNIDTQINKKIIFGLTILPFLFLVLFECILIMLLGYITQKNNRLSQIKLDSIKFSDVLKFSRKYWLHTFMFSFSSTTLYTFVSVSQQYLEDKYSLSLEEANHYSTFFNLISSFLSPFIGYLTYKIGREIIFLIVALLLATLAQILLAFTMINPYVTLSMFSLGICTVSICSWPMIALVVDDNQLGTAYGVVESIMNLTTALQPLVGLAMVNFGPNAVSLIFIGCLTFSFICALSLLFVDFKEKGTLMLSQEERKLRY